MGDATERLIEFWKGFAGGPHWVHPADEEVLSATRYRDRVRWDAPTNQADVIAELRRERSRLQASLIPQPFVGDLRRADIVMCLLNPGLDPGNWLDEGDGTIARGLKLAGLRQDTGRSPFWSIDPGIANTGAFRWWWPKFAALAEGLVGEGWTFDEAMSSLAQRVACVEIVPYHSRASGLITSDLIKALPSSRLAIDFVCERAAEGAQVILFRSHAAWGLADDGGLVRLVTDSMRSINVGPDTEAGRITRQRMNPDLPALASFAETFGAEGFSCGEWGGGQPMESGAVQFPYFSMSEQALAFVQAAYDGGWVLSDFTWSEWHGGEEAARLQHDPGAVEAASVRQLAKLMTTLVRGDRFSEGKLAGAFESGLILRIVRRVAELAALTGRQPVKLPDTWFTLTLHEGASLDLPGIYEWVIEGIGSYVGRYTRGTRPTKEYSRNVGNLLSGRGYRAGNAAGFRRIHVALADAVRARRGIELHILENPAAADVGARETALIAERGTLNGAGKAVGGVD
ncbi:hypothetical protein Sa4125_30150 [Aureimonas sp. SA4125]|uniref:DUF6508 domain-containing protein n=1 Tax=Aureimonas sp. SA4125 TaxID=2826993 RepID=UPI001CC5AC2A|nr:DUF6508 domain-containing protein [Aureimonas sp. SA4125]BDA85473.1 hypothetical protein Sa4125_30150 [Aureimonas sp. SA4125]